MRYKLNHVLAFVRVFYWHIIRASVMMQGGISEETGRATDRERGGNEFVAEKGKGPPK